MSTIQAEIQRIQKAKSDIKSAIVAKGGTISDNATLDTYADAISSLNVGGGALSTDQYEILKEAIESLRLSLASLAYKDNKPVFSWEDPTLHEYVQDGLAFHLDGINKGKVSGAWTDLVGGITFPNHGAKSIDNGWEFDGIDDWLGLEGSQYDLDFDNELCTIECAYYKNVIGQPISDPQGGFNVCTFGTVTTDNSHKVGLQFNSAYRARYINHMFVDGDNVITTNVWSDDNIDKVNAHTVSVNKKMAFDNEIQCVSLGTNHWTTNTGGRAIGCTHKDNTQTYFCRAGKIFAIRVYNRILTEEEMRQNQKVDNKRFNLGLTL